MYAELALKNYVLNSGT